ncbi:hypothetical protein Q4575_15985 [Psychrosphaera sp. 1_MG-2023]|uniref:hypothetical protein n=1 Tax=Psychrosphaera sp. 1_MG-2023 TaxID=3062643 RepID=UPI0026E28820|nr:hypothetical protein [Psychrosphaera sp. 1_MG-2023]MDO6720914.1 hypothetical protein [Psychrosphaera sp. 1_MG-2023]
MIEFKILEKTPSCARDKTHHYCDYIELITLCDGVDGVSNSDIYDRFLEDSRIPEIGSEDGAQSNELWVAEIDNWFSELKVRQSAYGDNYPFEFEGNRFCLKSELNDSHFIYIGLLLCSSLRYIENSSVLSSAFEYASLCAMTEYLPALAEVHIFGVSSRNEGRYTGSLENKIRLLSEDTNYPISSRSNIFRPADNGDGGVDIIAWLPFNEDTNIDKKLLFIGQSASTMGWPSKQHSGERLRSYLDIETTSLNTLYVPFDMRDYERNIKEWTIVTTDILFDRHRMLNLLKPETIFSGELGLEFKQLIESAIAFEEDIV